MNYCDLIKENGRLKNQIKNNAIMHVREINELIAKIKKLEQEQVSNE